MTKMDNKIEKLCRDKEQELLDKYFPGGSGYTTSEVIGEYTQDLPLKIEAEFRTYLEQLWAEYSTEPLMFAESTLGWQMTDDDREAVAAAYVDANRISLWERITNSNHEDVTYYRGLLYAYTKDLLLALRVYFLQKI